MEMLKKKRYLAIAGFAFVILGVFLPFFTVKFWGTTASAAMTEYWEGWVVFCLTLSAIGYVFKEELAKYVPSFDKLKYSNSKLVLAPVGGMVLFTVVLILRYFNSSKIVREYIHFGVGFYFVIIGLVLVVAHAILYKPDEAPAASVAPAPGTPVAPEAPAAPAAESVPEAPAQPTFKTCPQCGNQMDINATVCPVCGKQM
jgi:hypothetical protein